jgi:hypothetical protein
VELEEGGGIGSGVLPRRYLLNSLKFGGLVHGASGEEMGTSGEGVNGRALMVEWLGAVSRDVLIRVGRFAIHVKLHRSIF